MSLVLPACSSFSSDAPPVSDSTLVRVLVELQLVQAREELLPNSVPAGLRDSILTRYGLDETRFDEVRQYYIEHPDEYVEIYNRVLDQLSSEGGGGP